MAFDDVLAANERYAQTFDHHDMAGTARRGIMIICCMDSRIDPLRMTGMGISDAKVLRTPGGHVTHDALAGAILGVHKLGVSRIMVVAHTKCAMASSDDAALRAVISTNSGLDASWLDFGADPDQRGRLERDVEVLRHHPFVGVEVGGFSYDVDTGKLTELI